MNVVPKREYSSNDAEEMSIEEFRLRWDVLRYRVYTASSFEFRSFKPNYRA